MFKTLKNKTQSTDDWDKFIGSPPPLIHGKWEPLTLPPISMVEIYEALHNIFYGREYKEQIKSGIIRNYLERDHYIKQTQFINKNMELLLNSTSYKYTHDVTWQDNAIVIAYDKDIPKYQLLYDCMTEKWHAINQLNTDCLDSLYDKELGNLCTKLQEDYDITRFEYIKLYE